MHMLAALDLATGKIFYRIRDRIHDVNRIGIGLPTYGYHGTVGTYSIELDTKDMSLTNPATATRNPDGEMTWTTGDTTHVYQNSTGINAKRQLLEDEGSGTSRCGTWAATTGSPAWPNPFWPAPTSRGTYRS
jgi:hypothetical protein